VTKVHSRVGVRPNPRLLSVLTMAGDGDMTSVRMAKEFNIDIAHAASKLTNYCRLGYLERVGGMGKQFDPFRYRLTQDGKMRIYKLQEAAGEPVALRKPEPDFGPLMAWRSR